MKRTVWGADPQVYEAELILASQ